MTIYHADNSDRSQDTILCGDQLPRSYELPAAGLKIRFKSDGSNERKGFRLRYQSLGNSNNIKNNTLDTDLYLGALRGCRQISGEGGGGVLSHMAYTETCRWIGYGF